MNFAGCAGKYCQIDTKELIKNIYDNFDDAALVNTESNNLLQTLDFITPIVSNMYAFGQIAVAHALSDIYAMGGIPKYAMNIVLFPELNQTNKKELQDILIGANDKLKEANVQLVGGHTVMNSDIKYGISVTGIAQETTAYKSKLKEGDLLVLTKPIGVGILVGAVNLNILSDETDIINNCTQLNDSSVIQKFNIQAATDITGFGLGGHLIEMAEQSRVSIELDINNIPLLPNVKNIVFSTGLESIRMYENINYNKGKFTEIDNNWLNIIFDPQTSGGLILGISKEKEKEVTSYLQNIGFKGYVVGKVIKRMEKLLYLTD